MSFHVSPLRRASSPEVVEVCVISMIIFLSIHLYMSVEKVHMQHFSACAPQHEAPGFLYCPLFLERILLSFSGCAGIAFARC